MAAVHPLPREYPWQAERVAYGVCFTFGGDGNFDYMCGVEVASASDLPKGLTSLTAPGQRYAVFEHRGHIAAFRATNLDDLEQAVARIRPSGRRRTELQAVRTGVQSETGLGGFRNLGSSNTNERMAAEQ